MHCVVQQCVAVALMTNCIGMGVSAVACPSSRVSCPGVEILGAWMWAGLAVSQTEKYFLETCTHLTSDSSIDGEARHCPRRTVEQRDRHTTSGALAQIGEEARRLRPEGAMRRDGERDEAHAGGGARRTPC